MPHESRTTTPTPHNETLQVTVEICVDSFSLALAAQRGGADRIELCGPLRDGGVTPSAGLLTAVRRAIQLPIAVLIRPRTGDFTVSSDEFQVMQDDILYAKQAGADLAVLGILHNDGSVDLPRTRSLVELAHPMPVTFHRAFDVTINRPQALQDVIATGAKRILTSGGVSSSLEGAPAVRTLQRDAAGKIDFLLCGGMRAATAAESVSLSGVHEIHAALRQQRKSVAHSPKEQHLQAFANAVADLKAAANTRPASHIP